MIAPLPMGREHPVAPDWTIVEHPIAGSASLFLSDKSAIPAQAPHKPSHVLLRHILAAQRPDVSAAAWTFCRTAHGRLRIGQPPGERPPNVSVSATHDLIAVAVSAAGPIGIDMETRARIAGNVTAKDRWLSPEERRDFADLDGDALITELACCWVLKEAVGKANGVGLAMPLDALTSRVQGARAVMSAAGSAPAALVRWDLSLFGQDDLVIAVASRDDG